MTDIKPEGVLQNIITYLCFKSNPLSIRKILKMVYLVDVYHVKLYGKPLTDLFYIHGKHGAFTSLIYRTLEELYEKGIIKEVNVKTSKGHTATVPKPNVKETSIHISESGMDALEQVVEDWGKADADEVVAYTKKILPFLNTSEGERIDLTRCDPIICYAEEFNISISEAATLDILASEFLTKAILKADKEAKEGKLLTHKEVFC